MPVYSVRLVTRVVIPVAGVQQIIPGQGAGFPLQHNAEALHADSTKLFEIAAPVQADGQTDRFG